MFIENLEREGQIHKSVKSTPDGNVDDGPRIRASTAFLPLRSPICLSQSILLKLLNTRTASWGT